MVEAMEMVDCFCYFFIIGIAATVCNGNKC